MCLSLTKSLTMKKFTFENFSFKSLWTKKIKVKGKRKVNLKLG